jgi:hypothetical protein
MQMDLSDRALVVFRNASHGEINVVYRRDDGNIGWIDPAGPLRSSSGAVAHQKTRSSSGLPSPAEAGLAKAGAAAQQKKRSGSGSGAQPRAKKARKRR